MERESCSRGHRFREGDKFCGVCGEDRQGPRSRCPNCGHEDDPDMRFCTQCRTPLVADTVVTPSSSSFTPSIFGRNHDVFAAAVAGHENEVLSIGDLKELVNRVDPDFNSGSFLPNDHGDGNKGACSCSTKVSGASARPIFERVDRGLYKVLNYSGEPEVVNSEAPSDEAFVMAYGRDPTRIMTASRWLLEQAASRINRVLGYENPAKVLVGQKGGRWVAVGKSLPSNELTRGYETSWALGIDTRMDYELGHTPTAEPMYLGMRCNRNVGGVDGAMIRNALGKIFLGSWRPPDKYWPFWTEPNPFDEDGQVLNQDEYIDAIISQYVETYAIVLDRLKVS
jgi:hypothetical protein